MFVLRVFVAYDDDPLENRAMGAWIASSQARTTEGELSVKGVRRERGFFGVFEEMEIGFLFVLVYIVDVGPSLAVFFLEGHIGKDLWLATCSKRNRHCHCL